MLVGGYIPTINWLVENEVEYLHTTADKEGIIATITENDVYMNFETINMFKYINGEIYFIPEYDTNKYIDWHDIAYEIDVIDINTTEVSSWQELKNVIDENKNGSYNEKNRKYEVSKLEIKLKASDSWYADSNILIEPHQDITLTTDEEVTIYRDATLVDRTLIENKGTLTLGKDSMKGKLILDGNKSNVTAQECLIDVQFGKINIYNNVILQNNKKVQNGEYEWTTTAEKDYGVKGSAIYLNQSAINMYGGEIINNENDTIAIVDFNNTTASKQYSSRSEGAGIYLCNYSVLNMYSGTINNNVSENHTTYNFSGSTYNYVLKAEVNGVGICSYNSSVNIEKGEINGNIARNYSVANALKSSKISNLEIISYGTGICIKNGKYNDSSANLSNITSVGNESEVVPVVIVDNTSSINKTLEIGTKGTNMYLYDTNTILSNSNISEGVASKDTEAITTEGTIGNAIYKDCGGNLYSNSCDTLNINNTTLNEGSCDLGGGIFLSSGSSILTNCTINGNSANDSGGGIYTTGKLTLNGEIITNNTANTYGGGINWSEGEFIYRTGKVQDNTANVEGNDIYPELIKEPVITSVTGNPTTWTNQDVILIVEATDNLTEDLEYSFNNGQDWQTSNSATFSTNEMVNIQVRDEDGNLSEIVTEEITKIDKEKSLGTLSASTYITNQPTIMICVSEVEDQGGSGIKKVCGAAWTIRETNGSKTSWDQYNYDAENNRYYFTHTFSELPNRATGETNQGDGIYGFDAHVYDNAGNDTWIPTINVVYDTTAPTITSVIGNSEEWTEEAITLEVVASDNLSETIWYSFDNGKNWKTSNTAVFNTNQTIYIQVKDEAGNISEVVTEDINKIRHAESMQVKNAITDYIVTENFDITGMEVILTYDNGNTETTEDYTIENGKNLICGQQEIIIKYNKNPEIKANISIKVAHKEAIDQEVAATCTETGLTEGKHCSECDEVIVKQQITAALGHNYESKVTAPTCTEGGYTEYTCTRCEDYYKDSETEALDHSFTNYVSNNDATCTEDGTETAKCDRCDEIDERTEEGSMLDHTYESEVIAPTCTEGGHTIHECITCGDNYTDSYTDALGHNYKSEITAPTCTEGGYTEHTCTRCEDYYKDLETGALDHSFTNYVSNNDATCTGDGTETAKCDRCDETDERTDEGSMLDHNYESEVIEPTCTEGGYTTYECITCGDNYTDSYTDALGHNYKSEITAPTCTEGGYTEHTCTRCEDYYKDSETEALDHSFTNYVSNNDATCTEDGTETAKCDRCDEIDERTEEGSMLDHTYESEVIEPTCTEGGYTIHECITCGDAYEDTETEALDHNYETKVIAPTCTEGGYTEHTCTRCEDYYEDSETEALDHSFTNYVSNNDATCTEDGTETAKCDRCDEIDERTEEGSMLDHNYESEVIAPTCTEGGYTIHECITCGDAYEDTETEALGHNYETKVIAPTCTEGGYTEYTCIRCEDSYTDEYTNALDHSFTNYVSNNDATCTEDGTETAKCDRCDETDERTDEGSMLEHNYESEVIAPTCTEGGYTTYECITCGDNYTDLYTDALDHNYETKVIEPTCTEGGHTIHTCTRCEDYYTDTETEALDHSFTNYVSNNDATCTEDGTETAKCDRCDETDERTDEGSMLEHNYESEVIAPTCTESGCTEHICTMCGDEYIDSYTEQLEHDYKTKVIAPTCTEGGYTEYTCTRCEDSYTDEYTEALDHSFTNYISNNDATCTEDGTETAKCDRCEETDTQEDEESKISHNYENGICTGCGVEAPDIQITTEKYEIGDTYISKIKVETTIEQLKENIQTNATEINIYNKDGELQEDTAKLATGMQIELKLNEEIRTFTIVVTGDATGDGEVKFSDMLAINMHLLEKRKLEGAYFKAADVKQDGEIKFSDFLKINMFMLSKILEL